MHVRMVGCIVIHVLWETVIMDGTCGHEFCFEFQRVQNVFKISLKTDILFVYSKFLFSLLKCDL